MFCAQVCYGLPSWYVMADDVSSVCCCILLHVVGEPRLCVCCRKWCFDAEDGRREREVERTQKEAEKGGGTHTFFVRKPCVGGGKDGGVWRRMIRIEAWKCGEDGRRGERSWKRTKESGKGEGKAKRYTHIFWCRRVCVFARGELLLGKSLEKKTIFFMKKMKKEIYKKQLLITFC